MSSASQNIRRRNRAISWLQRGLSRARQQRVIFFSVGRWGERVASRYLDKHDCVTLAHNWRAARLEADLIAHHGRQIVIVEVKTRHYSLRHNFPAIEAVTPEKLKHLTTLGNRWMNNNGPFCRRFGARSFRVDIVEVYFRPLFGPFRRVTEVRWHRG